MTISGNDRRRNIDEAFAQMMDILQSNRFGFVHFAVGSAPFLHVLGTTWKDMENNGWIEDDSTLDEMRYRLTAAGWVEALERCGLMEEQEDGLIKLRAALKKCVKGRLLPQDVPVEIEYVIQQTELPFAWITNVIDSGLLQLRFPEDRVDVDWWDYDHQHTTLRVPVNFGMTTV